MLNKIKAHLAYYGLAAAHTFWQAAVASIAGANLGSVLGANHLPQVGELQKIALAAAVAGGAALLSYVKQLLVLVPPASQPAVEIDPPVGATSDNPAPDPLAPPSTSGQTNGTADAG